MLGAALEPDGATTGVMLGATAEDATGAGAWAAAGEPPELLPEPPQLPLGSLRSMGNTLSWSESPGLGNLRSPLSVAQPLPMLA